MLDRRSRAPVVRAIETGRRFRSALFLVLRRCWLRSGGGATDQDKGEQSRNVSRHRDVIARHALFGFSERVCVLGIV
jgi:hypothetical protein